MFSLSSAGELAIILWESNTCFLQALKELCPILSNAPFAPELTNLVVRLTTLAETVLTW